MAAIPAPWPWPAVGPSSSPTRRAAARRAAAGWSVYGAGRLDAAGHGRGGGRERQVGRAGLLQLRTGPGPPPALASFPARRSAGGRGGFSLLASGPRSWSRSPRRRQLGIRVRLGAASAHVRVRDRVRVRDHRCPWTRVALGRRPPGAPRRPAAVRPGVSRSPWWPGGCRRAPGSWPGRPGCLHPARGAGGCAGAGPGRAAGTSGPCHTPGRRRRLPCGTPGPGRR